MPLLGNLTADGSTDAELVNDKTTIQVVGTFGGGTLTIEGTLNDTDYTAVSSSAQLTAAGFVVLDLSAKIRATLAGATSPDIDIYYNAP